MADAIPDFAHGPLGRITYIRSTTPGRLGPLHSIRLPKCKPVIRILDTDAEQWVAPANTTLQSEPPARQTNAARVQTHERWLLHHHPEVAAGSGRPWRLPLARSLARYAHLDDATTTTTATGPLAALGVMLDASDAHANAGAPVLAAAGGVSGQDLRLIRMRPVNLGWEDVDDAAVEVAECDDDPDDETTWARDAVPIQKICVAAREAPYESVRWLLIQKPTSTTLLEPEYRAVPVEPGLTAGRPSRVVAKAMLSITTEDTAGRLHADVAFTAGLGRTPAQVAVVDECGYYHVWDAPRGRYHGRPTVERVQVLVGHITDGANSAAPLLSPHVPQPHGVLFVGRGDDGAGWDAGEGEGEASLDRSTTLMVWNSGMLALVDVPTGQPWKKMSGLLERTEKITDVQPSPTCRDHVFVLTSKRMIWLDVGGVGAAAPASRAPKVLVKTPHERDAAEEDDLRLAVCAEGGEGSGVVAMVYAIGSPLRATAYWFWRRTELKLPQFHRHTLGVVKGGGAVQTIVMRPCPPSRGRLEEGVRYYQLIVQTRDLGVRNMFCASVTPDPTSNSKSINDPPTIQPPSVLRAAAGTWSERSRQRQKWRRWMRAVEQAFVVPDDMGDLTRIARREGDETHEGEEMSLTLGGPLDSNATKILPPKMADFSLLGDTLRQSLVDTLAPSGGTVAVSSLFDGIQATIRRWQASGEQMPLLQLSNLVAGMDLLGVDIDMAGWHDGLARLQDMIGEGVTLVRTAPLLPDEDHGVGGWITLESVAAALAPVCLGTLPGDAPDDVREWRRRLLDRLVPAAALASYAVRLNAPRPTLFPPPSSASLGMLSSSQMTTVFPPSSQVSVKSSRSSKSASTSASAARASARSRSSAAISRLRSLAGNPLLAASSSLSSSASEPYELARAPQHPVLALWPDTPRVPVEEYVSTVAEASDRRFDGVRARREKRARASARQARRAEKYGGSSQAGGSSRAGTPYGGAGGWSDDGESASAWGGGHGSSLPLPRARRNTAVSITDPRSSLDRILSAGGGGGSLDLGRGGVSSSQVFSSATAATSILPSTERSELARPPLLPPAVVSSTQAQVLHSSQVPTLSQLPSQIGALSAMSQPVMGAHADVGRARKAKKVGGKIKGFK
jgi:RNA polymerase I-specific transcription initiation factor RRN6